MSVEAWRLLQTLTHYSLHFLVPGAIARVFFRDQWKRAWLIMLATMLVDLDHLAAWPHVFVPNRCGIGFHPLHTIWAMGGYAVMLAFPVTRIAGVGLLFHMFTDFQDCLWMDALAEMS